MDVVVAVVAVVDVEGDAVGAALGDEVGATGATHASISPIIK